MSCRKGQFHSAWQHGFQDGKRGRPMADRYVVRGKRKAPGGTWVDAWRAAYRDGWMAGKGTPVAQDRP